MSPHADHGPHDHADHRHSHRDRHHHHHHHHAGDDVRALTLALTITALGTIGELVVGWASGSLALVADGWHMVSDAGSLGLALAATKLSRRPRSPRKTFGYKRLEVLAALANGVMLGVVAVLVVIEAVQRFRTPTEIHSKAVIAMGAVTLVLNAAIAVHLSRQGGGNLNVKAALAHVIGDALGSAAAMLAGLIVLFTGETRADAVLSILVAALLLWNTWRLVGETSHILMEGTPTGFDPIQIEVAIAEVPGVSSVHDLHVWSIGAGEPAISAHIVLAQGGYHGDQVARAVCDALQRRFGVAHATIQPEPPPPRMVQLGTPDREFEPH